MLWRLRNRLIVTYVFIGVIPVSSCGPEPWFVFSVLPAFATSRYRRLVPSLRESSRRIRLSPTIWRRVCSKGGGETATLDSLRQSHKSWEGRRVHVWLGDKLILSNSPTGITVTPPPLPAYLNGSFRDVVRHHDKLSLRAAETIPTAGGRLTVLSSEPLDEQFLLGLATNLREISLYAWD